MEIVELSAAGEPRGVFAQEPFVDCVGRLELRFEKLSLADTDGQILVIYHAEAGSASAQALSRLAASAPPLAVNES